MSPTMRPGTPADMARVQEIVERIWAIGSDFALEEEFGAIGDESWDRWLVPKVMSRVWAEISSLTVTEVDGKIAGFITWQTDRARSVGSIHYNGVDPDFQGMGIGSMQVARALDAFREAGMELATVGTGLNEGHAPARRVYEKNGFMPVIDYIMYAQKL